MKWPSKSAVITFVISSLLGLGFGFIGLYRASVTQFNALFEHHQERFIDACRDGNIALMQQLYLQGASINAPADPGYTEPMGPAIIEASENIHPKAVQWLLERGAKWDVVVADGCTPLGSAELKKKQAEQTIEILKSYGAKTRH